MRRGGRVPCDLHQAGCFGRVGSMIIPVPVLVHASYIATAQGEVWKHVRCSHCQQPYAYSLSLKATGESHDLLFLDALGSKEEAQANADANLAEIGRNYVLPVPCPNCGYYQPDMARHLKDEAGINRSQIAGGLLLLLAFVLWASGFAAAWILSPIIGLAGLIVMSYGYVVAFRYDPNAGDPEARKAIGRKVAIWGESLAKLVDAASSSSAQLPADPAEKLKAMLAKP
jgi:hypothetical protein